MAKRKLAPNRGKHSVAKEAEDSALQQGALTAARDTPPPFASDAAESTAPSPLLVSNAADNTAPAPAKHMTSSSAKNKASTPDKNKPFASAKNKAPAPDKNKPSASAKNKALAPDKNRASPSSKNAVAVPAASDEDEVAAPPQDTTLRRFINFLREKAASMWWQGLLDAFLTWVHGSASDDTSHASSVESSQEAEAPTEGSAHEDQREKRYLEDTKNTKQQASPQLPEEHRCENHAYIYGHRNGRDCAKIEEDRSVPAGPSISQHGREFGETEAGRIIPAGPSISRIVEDSQKFDRYLSNDIHKDYIKIMSSCPPGMQVCAICFFERDNRCVRSHSNMIGHFGQKHGPSAGVKCKNCTARFLFECHRDLHGVHCNA